MGIRMFGAGITRQCRCVGTEAAEHESENENPAARLGQRVGSLRSG
jgi:hypothetical protein